MLIINKGLPRALIFTVVHATIPMVRDDCRILGNFVSNHCNFAEMRILCDQAGADLKCS